ncbi:hypothetical protein [uncultured Salipiger sp.]|uniref:hypothetical protein n=1 Tax=uncultured Salipiger sp. TaxID=499810 RepID=UPI002593F229|nr:hypothetical protein [uncultured Salipiger sp.]
MALHHITALMLLALGLWTARAYIPNLMATMTPPAAHLAWGFFFFAFGSIGRSVYWSLGRVVAGEDWPVLRALLGGLNVNMAFETCLLVGLVLILRARLLAIPELERGSYNIITCVTYPEPFRLSSIIRRKP